VSGTLTGVGLGPGDPDLLTVKAVRVLEEADIVAYFAKAGRCGYARTIAGRWLRPHCREIPLHYPVTTEVPFDDADYAAQLGGFYAAAAAALAEPLEAGRDVALLCEGDPLFYGSFMHLYARLRPRFACRIVPGVTGMSGCWTAAGLPMTWGDDVLAVLPGTLPAETLRERLCAADAVVIMKLGQNLRKVRAALAAANLTERAFYVERGTMESEVVLPLSAKLDDAAPYFSVILVPGQGRRP
jgi:precorrin-2/cobalt-factor-2 C20-methyltransferase